jgi:hypothetical protein
MGKKKDDTPPLSWFRAMNELMAEEFAEKVAEELKGRPDLVKALGDRLKCFIAWAGEMRLDYHANLDEEAEDFIKGDYRIHVRLQKVDPKKWKYITAQVFKRDNYTCHYCGQVGGILECDHKVAFSMGGSDELDNLLTACRRCNRRKRNKTYDEFIALLDEERNPLPF